MHYLIGEITDKDIALTLDDALPKDTLSVRRKGKLHNVSVKLDPLCMVLEKTGSYAKGDYLPNPGAIVGS